MKKKIFTLFAIFLSAFASTAMADEASTVSIDFTTAAEGTEYGKFPVNTAAGSHQLAGSLNSYISVKISTATTGNVYRQAPTNTTGVYFQDKQTTANSNITITANNAKITNITYTFGGAIYAPSSSSSGYNSTNSTAGITNTGVTSTFTNATGLSSVVMNFGKNTYAVRLTKLEVTYIPGEDETEYTVFNDAVEYPGTTYASIAGKNVNIDYKRTYYGFWQTLYVPFSLKVDDLKDYEIASIIGIRTGQDVSSGDSYDHMDAELLTSGSTEANTPYIIRHKNITDTENGEVKHIKIKNLYVEEAPTSTTPQESSTTKNVYRFYGTYTGSSDMEGDYSLNEGTLQPGDAGSTLAPQRWFMTVTPKSGNAKVETLNLSKMAIHIINGEDEESTGIKDIIEETNMSNNGCYNIAGQRVNTNSKGFVIKNGKKYYNK